MGIGALLPEKFDDLSVFEFVDIDVINLWNAGNSPMPAKTSRLSSMS
jgi:hypothetical protein